MRTSWYQSRAALIVYHILGWAALWFLPLLLRPSGPPPDLRPGHNEPIRELVIVRNLLWILLFYLNAYLLYPLLLRRQVARFLLFHLLTFMVIALANTALRENIPAKGLEAFRPHVFSQILPYLFLTAMSISYRLITDRIRAQKLEKERENEALKSELSLLRSQVSPHFMFNVLNSMVAMARKKAELEPSLIRLSSLMRYMIYSAHEDKVPLARELEYVQSYVDLQMMRFQDSVNVRYDVQVEEEQMFLIEPMLLIPFVENAFKHGTSLVQGPVIDIRLRVTGEGRLYLDVRNKFFEEPNAEPQPSSGIGLKNVGKRLQLLYPGQYQLVTQQEGEYHTRLELNLC
jgi:two-component system, LytTR family, sensor kinase